MITTMLWEREEPGNCPNLGKYISALVDPFEWSIVLYDKLYITDKSVMFRIDIGLHSDIPLAISTPSVLSRLMAMGCDGIKIRAHQMIFSSPLIQVGVDTVSCNTFDQFFCNLYSYRTIVDCNQLIEVLEALDDHDRITLRSDMVMCNHYQSVELPVNYNDYHKGITFSRKRMLKAIDLYKNSTLEIRFQSAKKAMLIIAGSDELLLMPYL